jgi:predicted DNA-binding transcriptional regulator AlpA
LSEVADRKSERHFLSGRLAFLILFTSLAFLTVSFFPNLLEQITVTTVHLCSWIWIERIFAMADLPKVVSAKVAARFVGLSESTLAKLRLNGNGPVYCKLGRRVVYRPADLEQWLQSRTARDTSDADAQFLKALTVAHPR